MIGRVGSDGGKWFIVFLYRYNSAEVTVSHEL